MAKKKSWRDKLVSGKPPHVVTLDKAFAGFPPGAALLIASPLRLQDVARRLILE